MEEGLSEAVIAGVEENLTGIQEIAGGGPGGAVFVVAEKSKAQIVRSRDLDEGQAVGHLYPCIVAESHYLTTSSRLWDMLRTHLQRCRSLGDSKGRSCGLRYREGGWGCEQVASEAECPQRAHSPKADQNARKRLTLSRYW